MEDVCLLTPLYAGKTYQIIREILDIGVGQSAGNVNLVEITLISESSYSLVDQLLVFSHKKPELCLLEATMLTINGSSETLRGDLNKKLAHIKHHKPTSDLELGQYLAGLFEGDGYISNIPQIVIAFHQKDKPSAETLKITFGHGHVNNVSGKRACTWIISNKAGIDKFLSLVNGHIRTDYKLNQITTNAGFASHVHSPIRRKGSLPPNFQATVDTSPLTNSWWLAGFMDADGSLYIQIVADSSRSDRVRVQLKVSLRAVYTSQILDQLSSVFGSTVFKRIHKPAKETYYWGSSTTKNAYKVYAYFHKYSFQSKKWLEFNCWRKALRLVYQNLHRTPDGLARIRFYKDQMSVLKGNKPS
jgi:hypothetical protein